MNIQHDGIALARRGWRTALTDFNEGPVCAGIFVNVLDLWIRLHYRWVAVSKTKLISCIDDIRRHRRIEDYRSFGLCW